MTRVSDGNSTILEQKLKNVRLVLLFSPVCGSHSFFVLHLHIDAFLNQKVDHLIAIRLYSIVDWPLILRVYNVYVSPESNQLLNCFNMTFSDCIIDRSLPIFVLTIYFDATSCT